MKYLLILLIILTSCVSNQDIKESKCVITRIEETVGSSIDSKSKFKLITDCGNIIIRDERYRIGDTIIIQEINIFNK